MTDPTGNNAAAMNVGEAMMGPSRLAPNTGAGYYVDTTGDYYGQFNASAYYINYVTGGVGADVASGTLGEDSAISLDFFFSMKQIELDIQLMLLDSFIKNAVQSIVYGAENFIKGIGHIGKAVGKGWRWYMQEIENNMARGHFFNRVHITMTTRLKRPIADDSFFPAFMFYDYSYRTENFWVDTNNGIPESWQKVYSEGREIVFWEATGHGWSDGSGIVTGTFGFRTDDLKELEQLVKGVFYPKARIELQMCNAYLGGKTSFAGTLQSMLPNADVVGYVGDPLLIDHWLPGMTWIHYSKEVIGLPWSGRVDKITRHYLYVPPGKQD